MAQNQELIKEINGLKREKKVLTDEKKRNTLVGKRKKDNEANNQGLNLSKLLTYFIGNDIAVNENEKLRIQEEYDELRQYSFCKGNTMVWTDNTIFS